MSCSSQYLTTSVAPFQKRFVAAALAAFRYRVVTTMTFFRPLFHSCRTFRLVLRLTPSSSIALSAIGSRCIRCYEPVLFDVVTLLITMRGLGPAPSRCSAVVTQRIPAHLPPLDFGDAILVGVSDSSQIRAQLFYIATVSQVTGDIHPPGTVVTRQYDLQRCGP